MNDLQFLQYALKQSFLEPEFKNFNNVDFLFRADAYGNGVFVPHNKYLSVYMIKTADIKKMIKDLRFDARKNALFLPEYRTFKHDFAENTIIPTDIAEINQLCELMEMPLINRQTAQKRRLMAVWSPLDFGDDVVAAEKSFRQCLLKLKKWQKNYSVAWDLALIKDFTKTYYRQMRRFFSFSFWALKNKRLLKKYALEAVQILLKGERLPSDFAETKKFKGSKIGEKYTEALQQLVLKITAMSDNEALLILTQSFLTDRKRYKRELKALGNMLTQSTDLAAVINFRKTLQKVFETFAQLCYLDAVKTAFAEVYLEQCPTERHQALPTVSPEREFKKVQKIWQSAEKVDYAQTRGGKLFVKAKDEFKKAVDALAKMV